MKITQEVDLVRRGFGLTKIGLFLVVCLCALVPNCSGIRARGRIHAASSKGCEFPDRWTGTWFQKGVHPPIRIQKDVFSLKGKCLAESSHMFYIEDTKEKCFRCVVIYEKHPNVLQYRETYCDGYRSLSQACSILNADAPLYSLFRVDAGPVGCDLRGPYTFSYSRGHGECAYPLSSVDSCADDSQLLFRFQACADVLGTESSVEELTCTAVWKEGSAHYLVGKITTRKSYKQSFTDENAYRCFVFDYLTEKGHGVIQMSQSADATCDGLVSPFEGSRTMKLTKSKHPVAGCAFPAFATSQHRWHTLDGRSHYAFGHRNASFRLQRDDQPDARFACIETVHLQADTSATVVAYSTSGCKNGFVCMKFHYRQKYIMEIQYGEIARSAHEACYNILSGTSTQEFVTLVAKSAPQTSCPQVSESGDLRVLLSHDASLALRPEPCRDASQVRVAGCRSSDGIEFVVGCAQHSHLKSFHCHGSWEEEGRNYLVAGLRNSGYKYCFVYWTTDKMTHLSGVHDTCRRGQTVSDSVTFNISAAGVCDASIHSSQSRSASPLALTVTFHLALLFARVLCQPIR